MDKRKVIAAYRSGFITIQECAQILGIDSIPIIGVMKEDAERREQVSLLAAQQPVNG